MAVSLSKIPEAQRLSILDSYNILDSAAEPAFDDIVTIAREVCAAPMALVSFVASDRQWFKAASGLDACETPLSQSVCAHALKQGGTLIIPDLSKDERTKHNTLVTGEPFIRFYAGALLSTAAGAPLGTLCVVDTKARPGGLTATQTVCLEALARQVMTLLEHRRAAYDREIALTEQTVTADQSLARARESERLTKLLRRSESRLQQAQAAARIGSFELDIATDQLTVTREFCRIFGLPMKNEYQAAEIEALFYPEDKKLSPNAARRADRKMLLDVEYRIRRADTGATQWISQRAEFIRDGAGKIRRMLGTVHDISERKGAEAQQKLLNEELSHRVKNTLALVQSIAGQTLKGESNRAAVEAFGQRIVALSRAHDVLLRQNWQTAEMRDVVDGVLGLHSVSERIALKGPQLILGPKAALSLSLLLHELATNAVKYGAWSAEAGRVELAWSIENDILTMSWQEKNGPAVTEPESTGFGSRLIDMGLMGTGVTIRRYDPSGFYAQMRAPLAMLKEK